MKSFRRRPFEPILSDWISRPDSNGNCLVYHVAMPLLSISNSNKIYKDTQRNSIVSMHTTGHTKTQFFHPMSMLHKLDCNFPSLGFKITTMVFIYLPFALPLSTGSLGDPRIRGFKVPLKVEIERKEFFVAVTVIRLDILAGPAQTLQESHKSDLGRDFIILNLIC